MSKPNSVVKLPTAMKVWDHLREMADRLESEGCGPKDFVVVVTINYDDKGEEYRLRADRHRHDGTAENVSVFEVCGALTMTVHDYNADTCKG